ncbi:MAG: hypothetical protein JNJ88_07315 [Planctomycetes bacterium]|nr:hypothetical protein [Planctomycetota bacterium]
MAGSTSARTLLGIGLGAAALAGIAAVWMLDFRGEEPRESAHSQMGSIGGSRSPGDGPLAGADGVEPVREERARPKAPEHRPGSPRLVPIDLTNLAPLAFGKDLWGKIVMDPEEWRSLFKQIHEFDHSYRSALEGEAPLPGFDVLDEAIFVLGLGERPRLDFTVALEPVEPIQEEARYRLRLETLPGHTTEVRVRPAHVYRLPRARLERGGLVVVDKDGVELLRLDAIAAPRR